MTINYDTLPAHMRDGAQLYVEHGKLSGGFLTAVLENDLVAAVSNADHVNLMFLHSWASWLYNEAPVSCWGSKEKVKVWCEAGGLVGLRSGSEA
jgi:hypothetical protein